MKEILWSVMTMVGFCLSAFMPGCAATPPPKIIHEDRVLSIRLIADRRTEVLHSHPSHLTAGQTAGILGGLRVLSAVTDDNADVQEGAPVFTRDEVRMIAPYLAQALDQAAPTQLITFHLRAGQPGDLSARRPITSGGLFVQDERLIVILANYRTAPYGNAFEGSTISEMDIRSDPLVPIVRGGYAVGFSPAAAAVRPGSARPGWSYVEEQKIVVIDLARLTGKAAE
jgi:hypothetical protein